MCIRMLFRVTWENTRKIPDVILGVTTELFCVVLCMVPARLLIEMFPSRQLEVLHCRVLNIQLLLLKAARTTIPTFGNLRPTWWAYLMLLTLGT